MRGIICQLQLQILLASTNFDAPCLLGEGTGTAGIKIWVGLAQLINFIGKEKKHLFCLGTLHVRRRYWNLRRRVSLHYVSYNHTRNSIPVNQFTPTADFTSAQLSEGRPQEVWSPNCVVLKWFLFSTCVLNKFRHGWTQVHSDGYLCAHSWAVCTPLPTWTCNALL